jgi:hypothetical protein
MTTTPPTMTSETLAVAQFLRTSAIYLGLAAPTREQPITPPPALARRPPSATCAASARAWVRRQP